MPFISVIVPVAKNDERWRVLETDLQILGDDVEILFMRDCGSRAEAMNAGSVKATGCYLWFLHADSRIMDKTYYALLTSLKHAPESLHYFNLAFTGKWFMQFNAWGAWFRSHLLGIPFGDQGFCILAESFNKIGGYVEGLTYGEDHIFVWHARQHAIPLCCTGATISTSARKYQKYGWLKTTLLHQYLWIKQAFPEWIKLLKIRCGV